MVDAPGRIEWAGARPLAAPTGELAGRAGAPREVFRPPTDAPVRDPFRPPPQPWLPGNRGIEYATSPGDAVAAIGRGRVVFAGLVAGRLVVSIDHPGGLRSSYTGLAALAVQRGSSVDGGDLVGRAGGPFHLGVRRGRRYLDPASLWGVPVGGGRVILVADPPRRTGRSWP